MAGEEHMAPLQTGSIEEEREGVDEVEGRKRKQKLTSRQRRFVDEYLIDYNSKVAVCRAGYAEARAGTTAKRLLSTPEVRKEIAQREQQRAARTRVTQDAIVKELAAVGFANLKDVCVWDDGCLTLRNSRDLSAAQAASIAEITETVTTRGGTVRVKQHSKLKALEMLAKHVGLYDQQEIEASGKELEELSPVLKKRLESIYGTLDLNAESNICPSDEPEGA